MPTSPSRGGTTMDDGSTIGNAFGAPSPINRGWPFPGTSGSQGFTGFDTTGGHLLCPAPRATPPPPEMTEPGDSGALHWNACRPGQRSSEATPIRGDSRKKNCTEAELEELVSTFHGMNINDQFVAMARKAQSADARERADGTRTIRIMLSVMGAIPIQAVIDTGIVPVLVSHLGVPGPDNAELRLEAAWALTNIASGTPEQTEVVAKAGAIPGMLKMLKDPDEELKEQALWGLGNIAGDRALFRDAILQESTTLRDFIAAVSCSTRASLVKTGIWALSNLCRGRPRPNLRLVAECIPLLTRLVHKLKDLEAQADCCWALDGIAETEEGIAYVVQHGAIPHIIQLLSSSNVHIVRPALRLVGQVSDTHGLQAISMKC
eukprot:GHVT01079324.1.p1 GENE.GHVT01079324.1~~GHVT01079324.1.p1  ORF type:complete len:377 (-),score=25.22 GHVT01079324.1:478-1608(-)